MPSTEVKPIPGDGVWAVDDLVEIIPAAVPSRDDRQQPPHVRAGRHVDGCGFDD